MYISLLYYVGYLMAVTTISHQYAALSEFTSADRFGYFYLFKHLFGQIHHIFRHIRLLFYQLVGFHTFVQTRRQLFTGNYAGYSGIGQDNGMVFYWERINIGLRDRKSVV